jgi:hypothetical protein
MLRRVVSETSATCTALYVEGAGPAAERDIVEFTAPVSRRLFRSVLAQKVQVDGPVPQDCIDSWQLTFAQKPIPVWAAHDVGKIVAPRPIGEIYRIELSYISSYGVRAVTGVRMYGSVNSGSIPNETGFSFGCPFLHETKTLGETFEFSPTPTPRFSGARVRCVRPAAVGADISSAPEKRENCLAEAARTTEEVIISSMGDSANTSSAPARAPENASAAPDVLEAANRELEAMRARVAKAAVDNQSALLQETQKQLAEMKALAARAEAERQVARKAAEEATRMNYISSFAVAHPDVSAALKNIVETLGETPVPASVVLSAVSAAERLSAAIPTGKYADEDVNSVRAALSVKAPAQVAESAHARPVTVKRGREDNVSSAKPVDPFMAYLAAAGVAGVQA